MLHCTNIKIVGTQTSLTAKQKPYTIYILEIVYDDDSKDQILRRYSELHKFFQLLMKNKSLVIETMPPFPPKKIFGNMNKDFVRKRREALDRWLQSISSVSGAMDSQEVHDLLNDENVGEDWNPEDLNLVPSRIAPPTPDERGGYASDDGDDWCSSDDGEDWNQSQEAVQPTQTETSESHQAQSPPPSPLSLSSSSAAAAAVLQSKEGPSAEEPSNAQPLSSSEGAGGSNKMRASVLADLRHTLEARQALRQLKKVQQPQDPSSAAPPQQQDSSSTPSSASTSTNALPPPPPPPSVIVNTTAPPPKESSGSHNVQPSVPKKEATKSNTRTSSVDDSSPMSRIDSADFDIESTLSIDDLNRRASVRLSAVTLSDTEPSTPSELVQQESTEYIITMPPEQHEQERIRLVRELIETDKAYIAKLKLLRNTYIVPLSVPISSPRNRRTSTAAPSLPPQSLSRLFGDVEVIRTSNEEFLAELEANPTSVASIFSRRTLTFKVYSTFVISYWSPIMESLENELQHNRAFALFVKEKSKTCDLSDTLFAPVARLPQYKSFVCAMLRHTAPDHPDNTLFMSSYNLLLHLVEYCDHEFSESGRIFVMQQLSKRLKMKHLFTPTRYLVIQETSRIRKVKRNEKSSVPCSIFLFNDMLLCVKTNRIKFSLRRIEMPLIPQLQIRVRRLPSWKHGFEVQSNQYTFKFECADQTVRDEWMNAIQQCLTAMARGMSGGFTAASSGSFKAKSPAKSPSPQDADAVFRAPSPSGATNPNSRGPLPALPVKQQNKTPVFPK